MAYNTKAKRKIFEFLLQNKEKSFSLEEICQQILTDGHGKSTVYRIVSDMVRSGEIRRIAMDTTRRVTYQYMGDDCCHEHLHLKCRDCGVLIHLDENVSTVLQRELSRYGGLSLDEDTLILGKCRECTALCTERGIKADV